MLGSKEICSKNRPLNQQKYGMTVWGWLEKSWEQCWTKNPPTVEEVRQLLQVAKDARELRTKKVA